MNLRLNLKNYGASWQDQKGCILNLTWEEALLTNYI